jgi:Fe-S cluster assembly protein SufD
MSNDAISYFSAKFSEENKKPGALAGFSDKAMAEFQKLGLPALRHEEWKYARVSNLFRKDLQIGKEETGITKADIDKFRLPDAESATELVFINGIFNPSLSVVRHLPEELIAIPLEDAANGDYAEFVKANLGHSADYHPDGIHALNAAFADNGLFIAAKKGKVIEKPVYIYNLADSRPGFIFAQPRTLVHVETAAQLQIAEQYITIGGNESFTNEVFEVVAEKDAIFDYYKIQNEGSLANHVGTTHIRQAGKCLTNAVTITLSGAMVRNNLNMIMESEHGESHMYGLYLLDGKTLADNHTIVDNVMPHCYSNELYKGIMDGESSGVFNGKIFVRKDAQKTNAYQSNKNILLSDSASANTKPQLEIFADDVKCSHGCTIGRLDDEALFYLRSRGISEKNAKSLLLHAFAVDILDNIKLRPLREHADSIISQRLDFNF